MNDIRDEVSKVVCNLIDGKKSFTAYDVTRLVREAVGMDRNVRHTDVHSFVDDLFIGGEMSDYVREGRFLSGSGAWARIYHDPNVDVMDYDENWLVIDNARKFSDCAKDEYLSTMENRLNIGPELLGHIGVGVGDDVEVNFDGHHLVLNKYVHTNVPQSNLLLDTLGRLKVDRCRRIRIGSRTLKAVKHCSKFKVEK